LTQISEFSHLLNLRTERAREHLESSASIAERKEGCSKSFGYEWWTSWSIANHADYSRM